MSENEAKSGVTLERIIISDQMLDLGVLKIILGGVIFIFLAPGEGL